MDYDVLFHYNTVRWYETFDDIRIDRAGMLILLASLHQTMRSRSWSMSAERQMRQIGAQMLIRLIDQGLKLPGNVIADFEKTFRVKAAKGVIV